MTKTTNFFTEMAVFAEHADLKLTITKKGDIMTVTLLPDLKGSGDALVPFTATGTHDELDEGFIPEMKKAIDTAGGLKVNTEQFSKAVKEEKEEIAEESTPSPKRAAKKSPAKKKDAKAKPASKKNVAKKSAPKKEEEPAEEATTEENGPQEIQQSLL